MMAKFLVEVQKLNIPHGMLNIGRSVEIMCVEHMSDCDGELENIPLCSPMESGEKLPKGNCRVRVEICTQSVFCQWFEVGRLQNQIIATLWRISTSPECHPNPKNPEKYLPCERSLDMWHLN